MSSAAFTPVPIVFHPILKERVWGGQRLATLGKQLPPDAPIGESWELADLPDDIPEGRSIIAKSELAGMTLREAIDAHERAILGHAARSPEGGFPLLIKYLDARENLSVQVHPDERYARAHSGAHLKSEAWYIVSADPGAVIYKGLRRGVTREEFARHIRDGTAADDLVAVTARPGECHYLPSGTCHALGAGILVAEVQTPSDTTFRVYDWDRSPRRELHIEQALECINFDAEPVPEHREAAPYRTLVDGGSFELITTPLLRTRYFRMERISVCAAETSSASGATCAVEIVTSGMPAVWMILAGSVRVQTIEGGSVDLSLGQTALIPAGLQGAVAHLGRDTVLLRITLPPPTEGMLA